MIVAIDGPAGSGKSAVGRRVAEALGLPFVDSGLMYRAIALLALERGLEPTDGAALSRLAHQVRLKVDGRKVWIDGDDYTDRVYSPELSEAASLVGKVAGVRLALVAQQRALGRPGVVMAGRDIGTVVFPDTLHKFFLTASVEERARRRAAQIDARGEQADPAQLRREVEERDRRDSQRSVAPMRAADDATVIDTNQLDLEATVAEVLRHIREQS
ncbi:MAG: (d)CMP kinase [Candidatus Dormibacteraeota bacterium]|nr:(d)CMP kinase [Candidatus Dormibacteraeota bacterium]